MNTTSALLIGFAAGYVAALITSGILRAIIILGIVVGLGFLGYLRFHA